jgi:hypothetical protein
MIVKVQMSQFTSDGVSRVLIYNESKSFTYEGGVNEDMVETMAGRPKAYFEAEMGPEGLEIGAEVEAPDW